MYLRRKRVRTVIVPLKQKSTNCYCTFDAKEYALLMYLRCKHAVTVSSMQKSTFEAKEYKTVIVPLMQKSTNCHCTFDANILLLYLWCKRVQTVLVDLRCKRVRTVIVPLMQKSTKIQVKDDSAVTAQ